MQNSEKLAIDGGCPVRTEAFAPWPYYARDEIDAVTRVLEAGRVNFWTGSECVRFEAEYAEHVGVRHAITLANGTLALELALYALDIGPGDEVIVPSRTFIATASAVVARGATPVVADIDPVTQNLNPATIAAVLTSRTRAIIAVHLAGWPCEMEPIMALAREHQVYVVEDCAQAHGARYAGRAVGSFGDAAAFSFCQDKIISTGGEGGMLLTDNTALWEKAWAYKDHGKSYDAVFRREHKPGFRWLHESFGSNWRMTEMQAALGRVQLRKLHDWMTTRGTHAAILEKSLESVPGLDLTPAPAHVAHARYRYYAFLDQKKLREDWDQTRVIAAVNAEGVPCFVGSCGEIYREKAFTAAGFQPVDRHPTAKRLAESSLAFLVHPTLSIGDMNDTGDAVRKVMRAAVKPKYRE